LQAAVAAGLRAPEAQERMAALGAVPVADSPEHFAGFVRREFERWGKLVRDANIRAD
jgi:tripartite-type tricarboxylate transporter receptor subunit TctC